MRLINIGLFNANTTVGAFTSNTDKIIERAHQMIADKCAIGVFPEMVIPGYPTEDWAQWKGFVNGQWEQLKRFIRETNGKSFHTVFTVGCIFPYEGNLYNCIAVVSNGALLGIVPKEKLPGYDIFYEPRVYSSWPAYRVVDIEFQEKSGFRYTVPFGDIIFKFPFGTVGIDICENIWVPDGPALRRAYSGAELFVNSSWSPFRFGILETRRELVSTRSADCQATFIYLNGQGGNDALVADGGWFLNMNGKMIADGERWEEAYSTQVIDLDQSERMRRENSTWRRGHLDYHTAHTPVQTIDCTATTIAAAPNQVNYNESESRPKSVFIPSGTPQASKQEEFFEDILNAAITGLYDYIVKTGAFSNISIALSGGSDSILSLIIAWHVRQKYFHGKENTQWEDIKKFIRCYSMPSKFNSDATKDIARTAAEELDVWFNESSIQEAVELEIASVMAANGTTELDPITKQNIQARIRGGKMWNHTNVTGGLFLQTGNMSEKATGYTTVGGDLMGGFGVINNLPKTVILALLHYLYKKRGWKFLKLLFETNPSAELSDDQSDEDDLMPFDILDACFRYFAGEKMLPAEVYLKLYADWSEDALKELYPKYEKGMLKKWVVKFTKLFMNSIFKWVQAPQGVHMGSLDLDRERALQLCVVISREWLELESLDELPNK